MRFLLKFTLTLFGAGVVLMVGMMVAGRQQPQEAWIVFKAYDDSSLIRIRPDGSQEKHIAYYPTGGYEALAMIPNSPYFVAQSYHYYDATRDLYRIGLSGSVRRLTYFSGDEEFVAISPDGQWVYFTYESQLYHVRPDGHDLSPLMDLPTKGHVSRWTQTDDWLNIEYSSIGRERWYLARIKPEKQLFQVVVEIREPFFGYLGFIGESPDQEWAYFYDPHGQNGYDKGAYRISDDGQKVEYLPEWPSRAYMFGWSDDGEWVYIGREYDEKLQLMRIHPDGTKLQPLNNEPAYWYENYALLSPDNRWIVYGIQPLDHRSITWSDHPPYDLVRKPVEGGQSQRLTVGLFSEAVVTWSKDGKWLYFVSNGLYRLDPEAGELQQISTHSVSPQWFFSEVMLPDPAWSSLGLVLGGIGLWAVGLIIGIRRS